MTVKLSLTGLNKLRYLDSGLQEPGFEKLLRTDRTRYLIIAVEPVKDIRNRDVDDDADPAKKLTTEVQISAIEPTLSESHENTIIDIMGQLNRARTHLFREEERRRNDELRGKIPGQEEMDLGDDDRDDDPGIDRGEDGDGEPGH